MRLAGCCLMDWVGAAVGGCHWVSAGRWTEKNPRYGSFEAAFQQKKKEKTEREREKKEKVNSPEMGDENNKKNK